MTTTHKLGFAFVFFVPRKKKRNAKGGGKDYFLGQTGRFSFMPGQFYLTFPGTGAISLYQMLDVFA